MRATGAEVRSYQPCLGWLERRTLLAGPPDLLGEAGSACARFASDGDDRPARRDRTTASRRTREES